jgi:tetratricopeptide (TPR) repeat protein
MRTGKTSNNFKNLVLILSVVVTAAAIVYFSGCAPTTQQTTISPERQKAIQDSIMKAYIFEIDKAWSTGYEYYKPKIYDRTIKPFWKVIKLDTINRYKDVYALLSDSYFKLGKPDSAQMILEMGLTKYPDNVGMRRNLAYILAGKEQIDEAITEYERVVTQDSTQVDDWRRLGNLYLRNDLIDEAVGAYQQIVALDPSDKEAQQTLGQLLMGTGDEEAALQALVKALKQDPENTQLMFDIGKSYYNQGDYENAENYFSQYLEKKPQDLVAMEYLGGSYFGTEQYREAIKVYKAIVDGQPDNKKIYTDIANCYKEIKQFQTARNYVYQATKVDRKYGLAYIVLGEIYEATVDECMQQTGKKSPKFDDKLVFQEAHRQYEIASRDLQFKDQALRKKSYLTDFLPSKEDKFFNKSRRQSNGKYTVTEKCYQWIASSL